MKFLKPLLIIFFIISFIIFFPKIVDQITITEGRPVSFNDEIKETGETILYSIDRLDPFNKNEQDIKYLWGWSFIGDASSQEDFAIYLRLQSDRKEYTYKTEILPRPDLNVAFPEVEYDLSIAGFKTYIAEEFIAPGTYNIYLIYQNKLTKQALYQQANKIIIRTPNNIYLELIYN
jgi:hypothetical protein